MAEMTREEWVRRYAARIKEQAGWADGEAMEAAEVGAIEYERNERGCGNAIVWGNPEDEADSEMSYWEYDGDE